jgi:general secretion pathway protein L
LEIGRDGPSLLVCGKDSSSTARITISPDHTDKARDQIRSVLHVLTLDDEVVVRLDGTLVLGSELDLPIAAERALQQVIRHQLGRLVPLDPNAVYFTHHIIQHSRDAKSMRVRVLMSKKAVVDGAVELASRLGLHVKVVVAGSGDGPGDHVVIWRQRERRITISARRIWLRGLEAATVGVLLLAGGLYVSRLNQQVVLLRHEVGELKRGSAKTTVLLSDLTHLKATLASVQARQSGALPLEVIGELTRLIPNDSWIYQLAIRGKSVEAAGYSPRPTELISSIASSRRFINPKFRSPITLAPDGAGNRFDLTFDINTAAAR